MTSADLHMEMLTELFGTFGLGAAELTQLDGILTSVANAMKDMKLSFETQSDTVDHTLTYDDLEHAAIESFNQHPDAGIITSFPGLGPLTGQHYDEATAFPASTRKLTHAA